MIDAHNGTSVGSIVTLNCDPRTGVFSYALDIAKPYRRKGYAEDAIRLIVAYYFRTLRFQKVNIAVHSDNKASIHLHKKLGFKHEGSQRQTVYKHGRYYNLEWFGLTASDFSE